MSLIYIHYEAGKVKQAKQGIEHLAILIPKLRNSTTVSASDLDLFLLNALLLMMTHPKLATIIFLYSLNSCK